VRTCALNYRAFWQRRGIHGVRLPHIVSSDIAGVVRRAQFGKGLLDVGESS
jgi:NADPH:quinone reductase-like Zn-dependent oxidoreductase